MEIKKGCYYNSQMNLFAYLAEEDRYRTFMRSGLMEVRRRTIVPMEEAEDIVSDAMERLLDYYARKPEKLLVLESMAEDKMNNYLKKALRNHLINVIKSRSRIHFMSLDKSTEPQMQNNDSKIDNEIDLQAIREELYYFIEEQFGREKWPQKKEAIDMYIERMVGKTTMGELQKRYPDKKIAVMNTVAHRIVKKYSHWSQDRDRPLNNILFGKNHEQ